MRVLLEWVQRSIGTLRPRRPDSDLEEELRLHLELAAEEARRQGQSEDQAVRAARLHAGGAAQAMVALRDQRGVPMVTGLTQDCRLAWRSFRAAPGVTAVAIVSLALAIGANTAIFSVVNGLMLRPLPVREPSRLVHVTDDVPTEAGVTRVRAWSYPAWEQIRQRSLFESATAWSFTRFNLASGGEAQMVEGIWVDGGFFDMLGVPALLGRTLSPADDSPGGGPDGVAVVISHGYWQRQYGGAPDAIGRSLQLNAVTVTIVGVTPPGFSGIEIGRTFDVIVPVHTEALMRGRDSVLASSASNFLTILARLRPGQSLQAAIAEFRQAQSSIREATADAWEKAVLDRYLAAPFTLVPAATGYSNLRRTYESPLLILAVVVSLVLLIGCLNIANLLLARAAARRHELSVQVALGASRWRLVRQRLVESLALSLSGSALGVAIASYFSRVLVWQLSTPANAVFLDVSIDSRVLGFTIVLTAATALLFGAAPEVRAASTQAVDAIREQGRASTEQARGGLMGWVVVAQAALSLVLLVAAGLFIQSFRSLASRDPGFQPEGVLVVTIDSLRADIDVPKRVPLYERARDAVVGLPGVVSAAISYLTPIGGGGFTPAVEIATLTGTTRVESDREVFGNLISDGWFGTFGTALVAGRDFTEKDRQGAPRVAIVNETFARRLLAGGSPLGRTITIYANTPRALQMEIVGVAEDALYSSPREPVPATWYAPIAQFDVPGFPFSFARLSVRASDGSPALLTKAIAAAVTSVNPQLTLTFRPLAGQLQASLMRERLMAQLAGFFGVLALLLAGLGLYGVTAHAISRRRTEIGIRLALGASPVGVIGLVLTRVWMLIAVGIAGGVAISVWASRFVAALIYGLPARDPATLIGAALVLFIVATGAGWYPARRAARIDPGTVLREG
jgi:putative ABC transport system permease protein